MTPTKEADIGKARNLSKYIDSSTPKHSEKSLGVSNYVAKKANFEKTSGVSLVICRIVTYHSQPLSIKCMSS